MREAGSAIVHLNVPKRGQHNECSQWKAQSRMLEYGKSSRKENNCDGIWKMVRERKELWKQGNSVGGNKKTGNREGKWNSSQEKRKAECWNMESGQGRKTTFATGKQGRWTHRNRVVAGLTPARACKQELRGSSGPFLPGIRSGPGIHAKLDQASGICCLRAS